MSSTRASPRWGQRFSDQEARFKRQNQELESAQEAHFSSLEHLAQSFDEWLPGIEGTIDAVRLEVKKLSLG